MISLRKLSTATKFLLFLAPILAASGCTTVEYPTTSSKAAALALAEPGPERLLRYCRRMADTNNLRIAVGVCQRALEAAPDNPAPVLALADAYISAQKEQEAAEAYRFALLIDASNPDAHYGLGKLYLKRSELEMAARHLEAALTSKSEDPAIYNALGILNDQRGDHATAQAHYHAGLTLDPDNSALANNLGVSLLLSERLNEGAELLGSVDIRERLNMTRRQNLAAAQAAIAASSAPKRQELLDSGFPVVSSLDRIQTVSSSKYGPAPVVGGARAEKAQQRLPQTKSVPKVEARPAPAPKLAIAAPAVTRAPTSRATGHPVGPITHDPLEASRNLELHPSITPAPVIVVDFQELPPLPKARRQIADTRPAVGPELEIVAETLPDLPNTTKPSTTDTGAAKTVTVAAARDLSGILPRRKPLALAELAPQVAPETAMPEHTVPEAAAPLLVADVPHLPIDEGSDAQDAADESLQADESDQRAETDGGPAQVATQLLAQTTVWGPEAAPGDELLTGLTASPQPVRFAGKTDAMPNPTATARSQGRGASPETLTKDRRAPASLRETARYHDSPNAGTEEEPAGDSKRGSGPETAPLWSFDLASLPTHPEHRDQEGEKGQTPLSPAQPSDQPSIDWSSLAAIRETPPDPEPAPRKEPLLALMMIQRDSFSSA